MYQEIERDGLKPAIEVKKRMLDLGLSQRNLAKKTGICEAYLSHFLRGRMRLNAIEKAKISAVLGERVE